MPRDAVSRTANVERNGGQKWVNAIQKRFLCVNVKAFCVKAFCVLSGKSFLFSEEVIQSACILINIYFMYVYNILINIYFMYM